MHNILLVEDDDAIATVVSAALEDDGYSVTRCASILERDKALTGQSYSVMLTDVMLTDGDGIESLPEVTAAHPAMPIIILSAQNTLDTAVRATDTGAFEYFPKPFDLDELSRAVNQAVGTRAEQSPRYRRSRWRIAIGRSQSSDAGRVPDDHPCLAQ